MAVLGPQRPEPVAIVAHAHVEGRFLLGGTRALCGALLHPLRLLSGSCPVLTAVWQLHIPRVQPCTPAAEQSFNSEMKLM